jgi:hypothetical protein
MVQRFGSAAEVFSALPAMSYDAALGALQRMLWGSALRFFEDHDDK